MGTNRCVYDDAGITVEVVLVLECGTKYEYNSNSRHRYLGYEITRASSTELITCLVPTEFWLQRALRPCGVANKLCYQCSDVAKSSRR